MAVQCCQNHTVGQAAQPSSSNHQHSESPAEERDSRFKQKMDRETLGYSPHGHESSVIAAQLGQLDPDTAAEVMKKADTEFDLSQERLPAWPGRTA